MMNLKKYLPNPRISGILFLIILLGLILRLYKISYGLPSISHEEFSTLGNAWFKEQINSYNPAWFSWPSLLFYLELIILKILRLFGSYEWFNFVLVSRLFQVIVGTITLPLIYIICCELYNERTGIFATLLVAIFPQHIIYSQLARPEVLVPFFYLLVLLLSIFILKHGRLRFYILAAIFSGMALSSKYNGIFSIFIPIAAHILRAKRRKKVKTAAFLSILIFVPFITFLIINPYSVFDYLSFGGGINYQASRIKFDLYEHVVKSTKVFIDSLGWIIFTFSFFGLIKYLFKTSTKNILVFTTFILSVLLVVMWNPSSRLLLISMLILIIIAASTLDIIFKQYIDKKPVIRAIIMSFVLLFSASLNFIYNDILLVKELSRKSITDAAIVWLREKAPKNSKVFWGFEAPIPYISLDNKLLYKTTGDIEPAILFKSNYQNFQKEGFDYIILTEQHRNLDPNNDPDQYRFYEDLRNNHSLVIFYWDRNDLDSYSAPFSQFFRSQKDYVKGSVYIYGKLKR